ncbi:MAG: DUF6340 family protein [Bacteroidales bacterium]
MKKLFYLSVFLIFLALSCTRTVYVPVQRPADVYVGSHIKNLAIVNRSIPEDSKLRDATDVLTGSLPGMNQEAAKRAIEGLYRNLQDSYRYDNVVRVTDEYKTPVLWGNWPPVLSWTEIEKISEKYNVDAVIVLESFDSNFIITDGSRNVSKKDSDGKARTVREFYAEGVATVKLGFRMYDPAMKEITDEYMYNHAKTWEASGNALQIVLGGLIDHRRAVVETGALSGSVYAGRISPQWFRVNREFYTKGRGNADFKIGVRRATVNDWEGAMEAWHKSVKSSKRKTAGRSAYNLALMYEIMGDLETAKQWAQKAYIDYGIKKGRNYTNILQRRIRNAELLP